MTKTYSQYIFKKYFKLPYAIIKLSIIDAIRKDGIEHAGYLAFLSVLSLFPFLIFIVSIAANFGSTQAGLDLVRSGLESLPGNIANSLEPRIAEIITGPPQGLLTVALIGIIWTASSTVEGMRTILNRAYQIETPPAYIWRRLLSVLQFFLIAVVILLTCVFFIIVPALLKKLEASFGIIFDFNYDVFYLRYIFIAAILITTIAAIYHVIPNIHQTWDNTFPGAIICVISWAIILKLFYLYLEKFKQFTLIYGGLGGIIGALIFFYLINLGIIIGAEFNYNFKRTYRRNLSFTKK